MLEHCCSWNIAVVMSYRTICTPGVLGLTSLSKPTQAKTIQKTLANLLMQLSHCFGHATKQQIMRVCSINNLIAL